MKCAVAGMLNRSSQVPPGRPPTSSAAIRTARCPAGIQVGFGSPWPRSARSRPPRSRTVIELFFACMTRAITVRSDQWRMRKSQGIRCGRRATSPRNRAQRGVRPPPSTRSVRSSAIMLEPSPYRTGSMCVSASGWNDEVIATPRLSFGPLVVGRSKPSSASELVRVSSPSRGERFGRVVRFSRWSSFWVPYVPAAKTTWPAVIVRVRPNTPVRRTVSSYPPVIGRTETTVVSGWIFAPAFSAR